MKNKRTLLGVGILVLVLVLGIGYAVVNTTALSISGSASVGDASLKVAFNGTAEVTEAAKADKVTATAADNSLTGTINVSNLTLNEEVTVKYGIKNSESDVNAEVLKESIENNKSTYFQVTTDVDSSPVTINADGTDYVNVTVKLIKTPVSTDDSTATIKVNLTASPAQ